MLANPIRLIEASAASVSATLDKNHRALSAIPGARIPDSFPPELLSDDALRWTLDTIAREGFDARWIAPRRSRSSPNGAISSVSNHQANLAFPDWPSECELPVCGRASPRCPWRSSAR
jgi:hypothetical protein